uniref:TATA element modulatory factor 1 TATA binding domain-containing protein n=1 Tax=Panagrolaimus sp. ES5 TaxID=591445 RepID=A0AC34GXZ9_9BILA
MSFLADYAKSAIIQAQKRIDTVLDIRPEEEAEEEEEENVLQNDDNVAEQEENSHVEHGSSKVGEEEAKSEKHDAWQLEGTSQNDPIVTEEPNPVRDLHVHGDVVICPDSPNSLSPTDDGRYPHASRSHSNTDETQASDFKSELPDPSEHHSLQPHFDPNSDEIVTIASSDIEVIRANDEWSTVSSHKPMTTDALSVSNIPPSIHHVVQSLNSHGNDEHQLASLKSQINMKDRQIEDLSASCKSLTQINNTLKQQNKKLTDKLSLMSKMQKDLVAKEVQIDELFAEGQKLSELNGRQSKEIKRLRQELSQLEIVTTARDAAVLELQTLSKKLEVAEQNIAELEAQVDAAESANEKVLMEMSQNQEDADMSSKQFAEQQAKYEEAEHIIHQLKTELAVSKKEKNDIIAERDAEQRARMKFQTDMAIKDEKIGGLLMDNESFTLKNERLKENIHELELRTQKYMENERNSAEQLAVATGPLLIRIDELENELKTSRFDYNSILTRCKTLEANRDESDVIKNKFEAKFQEQHSEILSLLRENQNLKHQVQTLEAKNIAVEQDSSSQLKALKKQFAEESEALSKMKKNFQNIMHDLKVQNEKNAELSPKVAAQESEIQKLNSKISELSQTKSAEMFTPRPESAASFGRRNTSSNLSDDFVNTSHLGFVDYNYSGTSNEFTALQSELLNMTNLYNQTLNRVQLLQTELSDKHKEHQRQIKLKDMDYERLSNDYEELLSEYGARVEQIEELQMDLDEVRKIVAQQAETVAKLELEIRKI